MSIAISPNKTVHFLDNVILSFPPTKDFSPKP